MAHQNQNQHYRSPFGDTTFTKVFVGGLAWETPTDLLHNYFLQFGHILEAVIITDKNTGKSKGYGFVTFRDPESANRACADPNPVIDGRRANCNIASLGRPNPSPGRNQTMNIYNGGGRGSSSYPPPLPPPTPVIYPPYGYTAYPQDYGYHQTMYYNQQQLYGSSATGSTPYYYGYAPRGGTFSIPPAQRIQGPSYLYYPTQLEGSSSPYHPQYHVLQQTPRLSFPSYTDSGAPLQTSTETEAGNSTT